MTLVQSLLWVMSFLQVQSFILGPVTKPVSCNDGRCHTENKRGVWHQKTQHVPLNFSFGMLALSINNSDSSLMDTQSTHFHSKTRNLTNDK